MIILCTNVLTIYQHVSFDHCIPTRVDVNHMIILTTVTQSSLALDASNVFITISWPCSAAIDSGVDWFYNNIESCHHTMHDGNIMHMHIQSCTTISPHPLLCT